MMYILCVIQPEEVDSTHLTLFSNVLVHLWIVTGPLGVSWCTPLNKIVSQAYEWTELIGIMIHFFSADSHTI